MVQINSKSFQQIVADQAAAMQATARRSLDFGRGSLLLMLARASASVGLWLQAQIFKVLSATRLTTSSGSDVDSFVEDFGMPRIKAVSAKGEVRIGRYTEGLVSSIPVGALIRTGDAQTSFTVSADPDHLLWDPAIPGYRLPATTLSTLVPVEAVSPGLGGNVEVGTISLLSTPITGVDYAINESPIRGGEEAEGDDSVKKRFPLYIGSLSQGTYQAIMYAISQVKASLAFSILEGEDAAPYGTDFVAVINNGSTTPDQSLINEIARVISPVRALGVSWTVIWSTVARADVTMFISTELARDKAQASADAAKAITAYISTLQMGEVLPYSRLANIAYLSNPKITNVVGVTLNGGVSDLVPAKTEVVNPGTISVA